MATIYTLHPDNPQRRGIEAITTELHKGAVMLYPTDTVYAIGCDLNVKSAVERVRRLKQMSNDKPLTFLCDSLSKIATYAVVSDPAYRLIRRLIPGPYTFLLPATKLVPRLVMSPKRRTTGIRVPDRAIPQAIVATLGNPVISTSALPVAFPDDDVTDWAQRSPVELFDALDGLVDVIVDDQSTALDVHVSTIIDVTGSDPVVTRQGLGWEAALNWGAETLV